MAEQKITDDYVQEFAGIMKKGLDHAAKAVQTHIRSFNMLLHPSQKYMFIHGLPDYTPNKEVARTIPSELGLTDRFMLVLRVQCRVGRSGESSTRPLKKIVGVLFHGSSRC